MISTIEVYEGVKVYRNDAGYFSRPVWQVSLGYHATLPEAHRAIRDWKKANPNASL